MSSENLVGQTLDGKYKIESEIGKGGMGTVYLSTHIGTERPVAVKVIAPQFMKRTEFVERFRREARAAGRLRHPNVVDVTDFGFSETKNGRVAYLVMEYLDGCTLGEILDEEKRLPLNWSLDILEQVCSAVQEAHNQGIIHRDLKPDNIWLEPNQRGGYTVKVLDFGIAKLEGSASDQVQTAGDLTGVSRKSRETQLIQDSSTVSEAAQTQTIHERKNATVISENYTLPENLHSKTFAAEAGTIIQPAAEIDTEGGTAILENVGTQILETENQGTKILDDGDQGTKFFSTAVETKDSELKRSTSELTRVGAVLGTPLYMSPEQCKGEKLTACSDIYSLGVIAYQMLAGMPPFSGDFTQVMESHKNSAPPLIERKEIPHRVKKVIFSALEKNASDRPQSAEAFASELRAQSEGIGTLLQRAMVIYSQHLPKFWLLSMIIFTPMIIITILQVTTNILQATESVSSLTATLFKVVLAIASMFLSFFCAYLMLGTITWMVTQILGAPLRPVEVRSAIAAVRKKWKKLVKTGMLSTALTLVGYAFCAVPGFILSILWLLVSPVVMMENLRGRAALRRSKDLVKRSLRTTTAAVILMFLVPMLGASILSFVVAASIKGFTGVSLDGTRIENTQPAPENANNASVPENEINISINGEEIKLDRSTKQPKKAMRDQLPGAIRDSLTQILMLPFTILLTPFTSIITVLLYLKTRQAGGESMLGLLGQFEESDEPRKKWQQHVRERLIQSGRITSRSS